MVFFVTQMRFHSRDNCSGDRYIGETRKIDGKKEERNLQTDLAYQTKRYRPKLKVASFIGCTIRT
jgi:hypothetical protein